MTKKIWLCLVVALSLVFLTGIIAYACGNHGGKASCPMGMKGAKVETSNIPNGIAVIISSDDPDVVKQIQDRTANCKCERKKNTRCEVTNVDNGATILVTSDDPDVVKDIQEHQADCMKNCQKECSKECLGARKGGKCCGYMSGCKRGHK